MRGGHKQQGIALITALLMTSLAAILAVNLVADQQLNIRRTSNMLDGERALVFAMGVESWVVHILARDDKAKDSLDEDWAVVLPPIPVEGGSVAGRLEDMQGRFNINNLVDKDGNSVQASVTQFVNLLRAVGLSDELASPVVDWLDKDSQLTVAGGWGAEDNEYSTLDLPYRTANQWMKSPSELMLVKGFTVEVYQQLAPFLAALPEPTLVNVNTASAEVIMSLSDQITRADAEAVIAAREESPFATAQAFSALNLIPQNAVPPTSIDVKSGYFLMDATARYGERGQAHMYSLLKRDNAKITVMMRAQGVY